MSQLGSEEDSDQRIRHLLKVLAYRFTYSDAACEVIVERALATIAADGQLVSMNAKTHLPRCAASCA